MSIIDESRERIYILKCIAFVILYSFIFILGMLYLVYKCTTTPWIYNNAGLCIALTFVFIASFMGSIVLNALVCNYLIKK